MPWTAFGVRDREPYHGCHASPPCAFYDTLVFCSPALIILQADEYHTPCDVNMEYHSHGTEIEGVSKIHSRSTTTSTEHAR